MCGRPAPPLAITCAYCGEDLPQRRSRLLVRIALAGAALLFTAAFVAARGGAQLPVKLTLPGTALVALGTGLCLLPPTLRGVAGSSRRERLGQAAPRYLGGMVLTLLTALVALAAGAPREWTMADTALVFASATPLIAAPPVCGIPWHKIAAGILLAVGLLLSR